MRFSSSIPYSKSSPEPELGGNEVFALYSYHLCDRRRQIEEIRKNRVRTIIVLVCSTTLLLCSVKPLLVILFLLIPVFLKLNSIVLGLLFLCVFIFLIGFVGKQSNPAPTAIQTGIQGLRLHWAYPLFTYSSPWISWKNVSGVSSRSFRPFQYVSFSRASEISVLEIRVDLNDSLKEVSGLLERLWIYLLFHTNLNHQSRLSFDLSCFMEQDAVSALIASVTHFLPEEKINIRVQQRMMEEQDISYTQLWLDDFRRGRSNSVGETLSQGVNLRSNKYRILEVLSVGWQTTTYLAEMFDDGSFLKKVVLKETVLPVAGGLEVRKTAWENVLKEVAILNDLHHPQIVNCREFFTEGDKAYICLDYVEGSTLRELILESGPMSENMVIGLVKQMAEILHYLHNQIPPILHKDFTPQNLVLRPDGMLVLIDFNIAERLDELTSSVVAGKQSYIPIEQFRGNATLQSDIYALGCTIYWLLTAQDPEPITTSRTINLNSGISQDMDELVSKATSIDAQDRWKDVDELLTARVFLCDL